MSTQTQPLTRTEINRENASHSTGPRTPEGKNKIRTNAVKHNLSGKEILLEPSEEQAFNALTKKLLEVFSPATEEEDDMVTEIRDAQWRLTSIPVIHLNLLAIVTEEHMAAFDDQGLTPEAQRAKARAAGYRANLRAFEQFSRHEGRLRRTVEKVSLVLQDFQLLRVQMEQQQALAKAVEQGKLIAVNLANMSSTMPSTKQSSTKQSEPAPAQNFTQMTKQTQPVFKTDKERIEAALNSPEPIRY